MAPLMGRPRRGASGDSGAPSGRGPRRIPGTSLNQQLKTAERREGENPAFARVFHSPNGDPQDEGDSHASIDDVVARRRARLDPGRGGLGVLRDNGRRLEGRVPCLYPASGILA